jgi:hypothetical protein
MNNIKIKENRIKAKKEIGTMLQWSPEMSVPRTFRWLLSSKTYPTIELWMKKVKTDYLNKSIEIQIYDDAQGEVFKWIDELLQAKSENFLTLTHLAEDGSAFCTTKFQKLTVVEHFTDYDYSKSDVLTHCLKIRYESLHRMNNENKKN